MVGKNHLADVTGTPFFEVERLLACYEAIFAPAIWNDAYEDVAAENIEHGSGDRMSSFVVGGPFSFHVVKLSSMHRVGLRYWQKIAREIADLAQVKIHVVPGKTYRVPESQTRVVRE
jgi:hypothetical protein